jgi:hypothetical protein
LVAQQAALAPELVALQLHVAAWVRHELVRAGETHLIHVLGAGNVAHYFVLGAPLSNSMLYRCLKYRHGRAVLRNYEYGPYYGVTRRIPNFEVRRYAFAFAKNINEIMLSLLQKVPQLSC